MHACELQMYGCCNISKLCQINEMYMYGGRIFVLVLALALY